MVIASSADCSAGGCLFSGQCTGAAFSNSASVLLSTSALNYVQNQTARIAFTVKPNNTEKKYSAVSFFHNIKSKVFPETDGRVGITLWRVEKKKKTQSKQDFTLELWKSFAPLQVHLSIQVGDMIWNFFFPFFLPRQDLLHHITQILVSEVKHAADR